MADDPTTTQVSTQVSQPTDVTVTSSGQTDPVALKADVDEEYAAKPHGGSKLVWIIVGLTVALIIIFGIVLVVFFLLGNKPAMHEIAVLNNCSQAINVLVGSDQTVGNVALSGRLNPGQVAYYWVTPAVYFTVQGYYDGTNVPSYPGTPFTKVKLWFASQNYTGPTQITNGHTILNVPRSNGPSSIHVTPNNTNPGAADQYDVSLQDGYNIPMGIVSTNFNNRNTSDMFSCVGPMFVSGITGSGLGNVCPTPLQYPNVNPYQACMSACFASSYTGNTGNIGITGGESSTFCCTSSGICSQTGGCSETWPSDYFNVFDDSCPNCMVTNCDPPLYYCGSQSGLTQYVITFCPS